MNTTQTRSSGVLLHPTSLPGKYGIGDLGQEAYYFVDFLVAAKQSLWQLLPLGPTGYGDSPYASFSSHAGNPLLINLEQLVQEGDLPEQALENTPQFPAHRVDYGPVITFKTDLLRTAAVTFARTASADRRVAFESFCESKKHWLDDFALFMALKDAHHGAAWNTWELDLIRRKPRVLARWAKEYADRIHFFKYCQFQFFKQWAMLRHYTNEHNIKIIGDIPIFVAPDSADVWAAPELFHVNDTGQLSVVAGVPPDYFSLTGQRWGNPLYRWDVVAADGFRWWIQRIRSVLEMVDILRIDHFRGFQDYWEIPANEPTAIKGRWLPGPGDSLFEALYQSFGDSIGGTLPIIAEDLGIISDDVRALRKRVGLPGMKVLHFAFSEDAEHEYLPHNYESTDYVVYLGTHDNDTTLSWFSTLTQQEREFVLRYLGHDGHDPVWAMMHLAFMSVADTAIVTVQDLLKLGSEARMNTPGVLGGNWEWRYWPGALYDGVAHWLGGLTTTFGRDRSQILKEPEKQSVLG